MVEKAAKNPAEKDENLVETFPSVFEKKHISELNDGLNDIIILNGNRVKYATSYGMGIIRN